MPKVQVLERHPHPKYPRLQVQLRSNSRYYQTYTFIDQKPRQQSLKTDQLPTALKLAEDWYKRELRASVTFGRQHPIAKLTTDPTMQELFTSYRSSLEKQKQPYVDQKWGPIADFWRARLLSSVNIDTFKDFYRWRRREKVKNHTLHKDVMLLRQILSYAIGEGMLEQLPRMPSVGTIKKNPRPWLTPTELDHLRRVALQRITDAPNKRVRKQRQDMLDAMDFLQASMLRVGEIRSLRFHSCRVGENTDGDKLLLCEVTGKRGTRTVVASEAAVNIYERRQKTAKAGDLIFSSHSRDAFRELLIAAGLRTDAQGFERNFKSIRATSISTTMLDHPDLNLTVIARNAGTSVQMIDQFYAKPLTAEMYKNELSTLTPDQRKNARVTRHLKEYKRQRDEKGKLKNV